MEGLGKGGDTLLSTPAIRAIRKGFPGTRVSALVSKGAKAVLLYNIRRRAFDLVVILHANDPDVAPLAYLSGAPHRMGWIESRLSFLPTMPVRTRVYGSHIIDIRLKNLEPLGIRSNDRRMELHLSREEEDIANRLIERLGLTGGPL